MKFSSANSGLIHRVGILFLIFATAGVIFFSYSPDSPIQTAGDQAGLYRGFIRSLNSSTPYGYKRVTEPEPVRAGQWAERFELRAGDCDAVPAWSDCENDRERTELKQLPPYIKEEEEHWFFWSIFVPEDYVNIYPVKVALAQFHMEGASAPPLMFQNGPGGYWADLNQIDAKHELLIPEQEFKGRWHDIMIQVKWSRRESGFLNIWVNGNLKLSHSGPNLKQSGAIFFKYGVYRSFLSRVPDPQSIPTQVVYFDEIKWGRSRSDVEPIKPSAP